MTNFRAPFGRLAAAAMAAAMVGGAEGHAQQYDPFKGGESKGQASTTAGDIAGPKDPVDFNAVQAGRDRVTRAISLTNEGGLPVKVTDIRLAAQDDQLEFSQQSCKDHDLPTGAKCTIAVTWRPSRPGRLDNVVLVEHSGRTRNITVALKGQAQAPGFARRNGAGEAEDLIIASPDKVDFGSPSRGSLSSNALLITNIDEQPITISRVELVGNPASLKISDDACSKRAIEPGRACLITLLYTPATAIDLSINMVVHHNGPRGYVVIPVTGKAPSGETQVASPNPAAAPAAAAGSMPSLIPDEPGQGGTRMRLRGTSGKNAIVERGGRTHIITDGKPFSFDGVTYKVVVSEGSVSLNADNAPTITLDGDPLPTPVAKRDAGSDKQAPPASAAPAAASPAPAAASPPAAAKTPTTPATATQAARPASAKPAPLFGPGTPAWPPISPALTAPAAPPSATPAPLTPAPSAPAVPKGAESGRVTPDLATQPVPPSASVAPPLTQAAVPSAPATMPALPKPASAANSLPQPRITLTPPPAPAKPGPTSDAEASPSVNTGPERVAP